MRILLESARTHSIPLGSLAASLILHITLGVPMWREAVDGGEQPRPESFITRALFVPPPDRHPSSMPDGERIAWMDVGAAGNGTAVTPDLPAGAALGGASGTGRDPGRDITLPESPDDSPAITLGTDTAYSVFDVDETVTRLADSDGPMYPNTLLEQRVEGKVYMRYVVGALGGIDTTTARVLTSTHPEFTRAVIAVLGRMRFAPATINGTPVSQLVEQEFAFRIQPAAVASAATPDDPETP